MKKIILLFICFVASCMPDRTAVSKEEALAAAKKMETIIKNRDAEAYNAFFDEPYMLKILMEKSKAFNNPGFAKGFKSTFSFKRIAETVMKEAQQGGNYHFLRSYEKDGRQRILFRAVSDNGLNYLDFHLLKIKNKVKAVDILSYLTGEDLTTTLADAISAMEPEEMKGTQMDSIRMIKKLREQGEHQRIKEIYEGLPVTLQETRAFLMFYVQSCREISDSVYAMSLEKMARILPVTPSSYLMMIDAYTHAKDYDKALMAIDKVDAFTGGDPFLDYYRGNVYWTKGDQDKAIAFFEKVYAYDPNQFMSVDALLVVYTEVNETEKAKKVLAAYKNSKIFEQQKLDLFQIAYPVLFH